MKGIALGLLTMVCGLNAAVAAQPVKGWGPMVTAPVPTSCVSTGFTRTGEESWYIFNLKVTNNCGKDVNFQNSSIQFQSNFPKEVPYWGEFTPLAYPDSQTVITTPEGTTKSTLSLHFPEADWANKVLHDKESFTIIFGLSGDYTASNAVVYIEGDTPIATGELDVTNATAKPAKVTQTYTLVDLIFNGQKINTVQVPWASKLPITNLTPGNYTLQPQSVLDTDQNTYEGTASPSVVAVVADKVVNSTISYQQVVRTGTINVKAPALPSSISGYTGTPVVTFRRADTGAALSKNVTWNTTTVVSNLDNNVTYQLSTPTITYNGFTCVGTLTPASLISSATNPPTSQLSYTCSSVSQDTINLSVSGLPCETTSITVSFQPSDGSAKITKAISISAGKGTGTVQLTDGVVYGVSATTVTGYSAVFNPQPLTAKPNLTETITYQPVPKK